jgi:YjbE family integral membrane protein
VLSNPAFGLALVQIVWINLVLSGDNAVVIALASRSLPIHLQKCGVLLGTVPAILLRILFSSVIGYLITIPLLKIAGGALLIWIALRLSSPEPAANDRAVGSATIWTAAWTIIVADTVMSLDNVVAIAAAAHGNMALLAIGLLISMPMVICGATLLLRLLNRFPLLIVSDPRLVAFLGRLEEPASFLAPALLAACVAAFGLKTSAQRRIAAAPIPMQQHRKAA